MLRHLTYTQAEQRQQAKHQGYLWKAPEQTYQDGHGFCYELAAFALSAIQHSKLGRAQLLFVAWDEWGQSTNTSHCICYFNDNQGHYHCVDNGLIKGPFNRQMLLQCSARKHTIKYYRVFDAHEIPYRTPFNELGKLLRAANPVTGLAFA